MRHKKKRNKINRKPAHAKSTFNSIASSVIENYRITTTLIKAKKTQPLVDKLITLGKQNTLHSRRQASKVIKSKDVLRKLFEEVAPLFKKRKGGYSRIIKLGNRAGDNAPIAILELVEMKKEAKKPKKKTETLKTKKKVEEKEKKQDKEEKKDKKKGFTEGLRDFFKKKE